MKGYETPGPPQPHAEGIGCRAAGLNHHDEELFIEK